MWMKYLVLASLIVGRRLLIVFFVHWIAQQMTDVLKHMDSVISHNLKFEYEEDKRMKDLLPIGSVVALKEGKKKLMIIGRIQENEKTKKLYDYAGCNWPEGYMDKDHCYVFNHEDIDCLYYIGLQDIEEFNYRFELDEKLKEMK